AFWLTYAIRLFKVWSNTINTSSSILFTFPAFRISAFITILIIPKDIVIATFGYTVVIFKIEFLNTIITAIFILTFFTISFTLLTLFYIIREEFKVTNTAVRNT